MHVENEGEKYVCNICGNEVLVTNAGGGELVCCNEPRGLGAPVVGDYSE